MSIPQTVCLRISASLMIAFGAATAATAEFAIKDGDTVAFLGDSITAARTYGKLIENYTLLRYPDRKVTFINVGRGGETAVGALERLERDVFARNVTLLTVAYGINDIGWGMRADEAHRQAYLDAIRDIVVACRARGVRVFICSAAVTGADPFKSEDDFLQKMCDEGMKVARENGGEAIDVQRTMRDIQKRVWNANERTTNEKQKSSLHTEDTIHLNDLGQLAMAFAILKGLGAPNIVSAVSLDAEDGTLLSAEGCTVSDIEKRDHRLEFTRLDDGLPFNNGVFSSLNYRFVPIPDELNRYMLTVKNLDDGEYRLVVSGRAIGAFSDERLSGGVNIASATADPWKPGGPWDAQADLLRALAEARENTDEAVRKTPNLIEDDELAASFADRCSSVRAELLELERVIARPRPYRFVLTRIDSKSDSAEDLTQTPEEREVARAANDSENDSKEVAQKADSASGVESSSSTIDAPAISLLSPSEYQVFQRHRRAEGNILVSGRTTETGDEVQVRFTGTPLEGELPDDWESIDYSSASNEFNEVLNLPAGGWYSMEIRVLDNDKVVATTDIDKFGIGEVFVGAGQSNSTNCGETPTKQSSGMVASFGGDKWQLANDPQLGVADHSKGGSFWPAFGDAMFARYQVPIGVATTGFGGTSVNQWQPEEGLFKWTMTRIHQLGPMGFRGLLWHQGESDVGMSADEYYGKLKTVIVASRDRAGWEIPWFVAQVSYHNPDKPSFDSTRSAQARLWKDKVALEGPDTDALTGDHRDLGGAGIHFSPKGLKAHGEMWVEMVSPFVDQMLQENESGSTQGATRVSE